MALNKVNYVDNQTIITAQNLNDIQDNIIQNSELIKKVAPRNLLDNSDFRNPVNQRDYDGHLTNKYAIDRWYFYKMAGEFSDNGITLSGDMIWQVLNNIGSGKKVTGVVCLSDGTMYLQSAAIPSVGTVAKTVYNKTYDDGRNIALNLSTENTLQFIFQLGESSATVAWAALYEGEYTAETLPEYQPKGYGAELAECKRYYRILKGDPTVAGLTGNTATNVYVVDPEYREMRTWPTVTAGGSIDVCVGGKYYPCTMVSALFNNYGSRFVAEYTEETPPTKTACVIAAYNGIELSADL